MITPLKLIAGAALALACAAGAQAQQPTNFPTREIKAIVPYAAGGADVYIRPLADAIKSKHNMQMIVMNQPGAGGITGANAVHRSEADGHTLLFAGTAALTSAPRFQKAEYDISGFEPVMHLITIPFLITVKKDAPYKTLPEFVEYARKNPGKITYGTTGVGGSPHLAMEALILAAKIQLTHVPFTGIAQAVPALLGGHVDAIIGAPSNIMPQVQSGDFIALATSSPKRFKPTPNIPALGEYGYDVDVGANFAFFAPKGTPKPVIDKLYTVLKEAASDPAYQANMTKLFNEVLILGPDDLAKRLAAEDKVFGELIAKLPKK